MLDKISTPLINFLKFFILPLGLIKLHSSININFSIDYIFAFLLTIYFLFICNVQGFLLDRKFKIYYRLNSSIDRPLYRMIFGLSFFHLLMMLGSLINTEFHKTFILVVWITIGILYCFVKEKRKSQDLVNLLQEYKNFDYFEKLSLVIFLIIAFISFPGVVELKDTASYFSFYDPENLLTRSIRIFFSDSLLVFMKEGFNLEFHFYLFYFVFILIIPTCFYSLLRHFYSRRLSLLGILTFISAWQSSSYRSGLFYGLLAFLGQSVNPASFFIFSIMMALFYFIFYRESSVWYRIQFIKYNLLGILGMVALFIFNPIERVNENIYLFENVMKLIQGKDILILFFPGALIILYQLILKQELKSDLYNKWAQLLIISSVYTITSSFFATSFIGLSFTLAFLIIVSLFPIEKIFKQLYGFRSKRNLIFATYILICLLDSRLEARVKTLLKMINLE